MDKDLLREGINFLKKQPKSPIEIQILNLGNELYGHAISQIESLVLSGQCHEAAAQLAKLKTELSRHFNSLVIDAKHRLQNEAGHEPQIPKQEDHKDTKPPYPYIDLELSRLREAIRWYEIEWPQESTQGTNRPNETSQT